MPTTVPTVERDWGRIDAGHQAVDQLNQIIGELRGTLDHDPEARGELEAALAVLLGHDQPATVGIPITVVDSKARKITVTARDMGTEAGDDYHWGQVDIRENWDDETLNAWIPLDPDDADRLADAIHAAAAAARQAVSR